MKLHLISSRRIKYTRGRVRRWVSNNQRLARSAGLVVFALLLLLVWYIPGLKAAPGNWWNSSWNNRKKITFNNAASTENLVNFPVRVSLTSAQIDYAKTQNAGQDIRFTDSDGTTPLDYEIETWNEAGTSEVWVRVPQIDAGSTTDGIYMYYNNPGAADGQNSGGTWSNNYSGVWHMNEDPAGAAPQMKDSTTNALHGTTAGAMTASDQIPGQIGGSLDMDGDDDVQIGDTAALDPATDMEVSAWAKITTTTATTRVVYKAHSAAPWFSYALQVDSSGTAVFIYNNAAGTETVTSSTAVLTLGWHYLSGVRSGNNTYLYVDGARVGSATTSGNILNADDILEIGNAYTTNQPIRQLDEVRIAAAARSDDWMKAQYASMTNAMNTFGAEETYVAFTQATYRWFKNADSVQPGTGLATSDNPYTMVCGKYHPLRLRVGLGVTGPLAAGSQQFKLQYAGSTAGPWKDVSALSGTGTGSSSWYNTAWSSRKKITFNNAASTENLVNFPVRVSLTSAQIDYAKTQNAGQDIRFTDSDGTTPLDYEIETWNEAGTSEVWVRVPQIDAGSTTDGIYMYYNNPGAADGQNSGGTWSNNYSGVWHMNEDPAGAAPQMQDSSSQAAHGTTNGAMLSSDSVPAAIGNGLRMDGVDDYVSVPHNNLHNLNGSFTVGTFIKWDTVAGTYPKFAGKGYGWLTADRWVFGMEAANMRFFMGKSGDKYMNGNNTYDLSTTAYVRVDVSYDASTSVMSFYYNGVLANTLSAVTFPNVTLTDQLTIGSGDKNYEGVKRMDEFRIENAARSADWMKAQYASMTNAMNSFGSEESDQSVWSFYDNPTPVDGAGITSLLLSGSTVLQSYAESNPTVSNPNAVISGGRGEWDFSLNSTNASVGSHYFRVIESDGTAVETYTVYPRIDIRAVTPQENVMRHGTYFAGNTKQSFGCGWVGN